jgi:uncharacterized membrane protein YedE/YeeE
MHDLTPIPALLGGAMIGLAASILLFFHGKVAGVSGIFGGLFAGGADRGFRLSFLAGLVAAGVGARLFAPHAFATSWSASLPLALGAGVIVGFGTQMGGGCTSGHGVCGISRLSKRSTVATIAFMAAGFAVVFVIRHVLGGRP